MHTEVTIQRNARLTGVFWLLVIVVGMSSFLLSGRLIVRGDAAATAANILASQSLYRLGFVLDVLSGAIYLIVTVLLYDLLRPVSRTTSLVSAVCGVVGVAAGSASSLSTLHPLIVLGNAAYLSAFTPEQLQALAYVSLRMNTQGFGLSMLFFGMQVLVAGVLIARSGFLPRTIGVMLAVGGASYVISSLANFLAPAVGAYLSPFVVPAALIGEGTLTVWLLVKGVNTARWQEKASAA